MKFLLIILFGFCMAASVQAAKPKANASPSATPEDRVAFHGPIVSVSKAGRTFTLKGKKGPVVYIISDATKMMKGTVEGTENDLAAGVYVRGSAKHGLDGMFNALTVKIELPAK